MKVQLETLVIENNETNRNALEDTLIDIKIKESPKTGVLPYIKNKVNYYYIKLKDSYIDAFYGGLGVVTVGNIFWAPIDTQICGMSPQISFNNKINGTVGCLTVLGYIGNGIRNYYQKKVGIDINSSKTKITLHDIAIGGITSLLIGLPMNLLSGERDPKVLGYTLLVSTAINLPMGIVNGYAMDYSKDLFGVKESKRMPKLIKESSSYTKKTIGVGLAVASALGTYCYLKSIGL